MSSQTNRMAIAAAMLSLWIPAVRAQAQAPGSAAKAAPFEVVLKVDFESPPPDQADKPGAFAAGGAGKLEIVPSEQPLSGKCLHVSRAGPGYFGAGTPAVTNGSRGLKIAFMARAKDLTELPVNFRDLAKDDNTTPVSPARVGARWTPVVYSVEEFRYNGGDDARIAEDTRFVSLLLHADGGDNAEFWVDNLVIYRGDDTQPPAPPRMLKVTPGKDGQVELTWQQGDDNAFPAMYCVYRRAVGIWEKLGETVEMHFSDLAAAPGLYTYGVAAVDYENNCSRPAMTLPTAIKSGGKPATASAPAASDAAVRDRPNFSSTVKAAYNVGLRKVRRDAIMFFGDSNTEANAYANGLVGHLGRGRLIRQSAGGQTSAGAMEKIAPALAEHKPQYAVIMLGTNDEKATPQQIAQSVQNLSAIADACLQAGTIPIVSTIPPRNNDKQAQQPQQAFNQALVQMCRTKKLPVTYAFEEMMQGDLAEMLLDGVHLSPKVGVDAAGRALRRTFDQIGWCLRDTRTQFQ